jgi:hypothetical protein
MSHFAKDVNYGLIPVWVKEWVHVSPPMISKRCFVAASVIGGKIYVRNRLPSHHTADCWSEVFDPVNRK